MSQFETQVTPDSETTLLCLEGVAALSDAYDEAVAKVRRCELVSEVAKDDDRRRCSRIVCDVRPARDDTPCRLSRSWRS